MVDADAELFSKANEIEPRNSPKFKRGVRRIPKTHRVDQLVFERAVAAAYLAHSRGFPIEPETIHAQDRTLSIPLITDLIFTERFKDALEDRGIPTDAPIGLTGEQLYVLQVMLDPTTNLSPWGRLKKLDIPFAKWEGWLKQPLFNRAYTENTEKILKESVPNALNMLMMLVNQGDLKAIKLNLELTGRYTPNQQNQVDFQRLMGIIMEALEANISDDGDYARTVAAIAQATGDTVGLDIPEYAEVVEDTPAEESEEPTE